jgi:hypothetical protein
LRPIRREVDYALETGWGDMHFGNSNCGHDFGTDLSHLEKKACAVIGRENRRSRSPEHR